MVGRLVTRLRQERFRRRLVLPGLVLALLVTLPLAALWLTRLVPAWMESPDQPGAGLVAERVENRLLAEATRVRPAAGGGGDYRSGEWTVRVTEDEANAWLAQRLPRWVSSRAVWPAGLEKIRVRMKPDEVVVGAVVEIAGERRAVSAGAGLRLRDGRIWLVASGMRVGSLPMARSWAVSLAPEGSMRAGGVDWGSVLEGREALGDARVLSLEDGRRVRVVTVRVGEGWLEADCVTEK